jgi:hypothetical protein
VPSKTEVSCWAAAVVVVGGSVPRGDESGGARPTFVVVGLSESGKMSLVVTRIWLVPAVSRERRNAFHIRHVVSRTISHTQVDSALSESRG